MLALVDWFAASLSPEVLPVGAVVVALIFAGGAYVAVTGFFARKTVRRRLRVELPTSADSKTIDAAETLTIGVPGRRNAVVLDTVLDRANAMVRQMDAGKIKLVRQRMIRAGYFGDNAVALFFLSRLAGAALLPLAVAGSVFAFDLDLSRPTVMLFMTFGAVFGYLLPSLYVDKRAKAVLRENRSAFPDFMDLMGVCANAGLSMEAGLERVTQELSPMYPTLGVNLQILCLEMRAGRAIDVALQMLAQRLDLAEVRAFATLLQQSKELGSSLSDALRVFSEDMRHQRLASAEEKAYALPAKLSVPVTACILPVVLFIAIWPVVVEFNS